MLRGTTLIIDPTGVDTLIIAADDLIYGGLEFREVCKVGALSSRLAFGATSMLAATFPKLSLNYQFDHFLSAALNDQTFQKAEDIATAIASNLQRFFEPLNSPEALNEHLVHFTPDDNPLIRFLIVFLEDSVAPGWFELRLEINHQKTPLFP